ncbi:MAG: M14 family zinc carboxypeptidase [Xanthomonadales bacterium]|nr:M14 family zinc carboxypeptidase [Xanthomonadales bacterium]
MSRFSTVFLTGLLLVSSQLNAQVLTEWVESKTPGDTTKIELGYPVPIPVDTPEPFDGFRTYAGLHMRHQDLAATTPWVHPEPIGVTHQDRTIWAYRLGDDDLLTVDGLPEAATLTNGGIHAREWQTPETVTGILELLATHESDNHFYDYLRDNVNMIVIPSLNIDGFMQTQRYPILNYLQSDPDNPDYSPRDGRMRRKNMLNTDEDLFTTFDHLNGVDLNRNSAPYWATNLDRSSFDPQSIVHHGASPASEPEIQALDAAGQLGPIDRLRLFTDVHSYSMVTYWLRTNNFRLARENEKIQQTFSNHHRTFPAGKQYAVTSINDAALNQGFGMTNEYFTSTYHIPAWGLEVEPSNGAAYHFPLPGAGADYGGVGENSHDGFILPESEIRRVREELAQSFAAIYYRQAGPPTIHALRMIDTDTGAVVFEAEWDTVDNQTRSLYSKQLQPLQLNHRYDAWLSFDKPMRWREDGQVVPFPGQLSSTLDLNADILVFDTAMTTTLEAADWLNQAGGTPDGYMNYQDDALKLTFTFPADEQNLGLVTGLEEATIELTTTDMTGMRTDANPATVANWEEGVWKRYESTSGTEGDIGGVDATISFQVTDQAVPPPFLLEAGITAAWYDPKHDGEGFLLEMLADNAAVMYWFTYDANGEQDWYIAAGEVRGNRIVFPSLLRISGGEFGPGFDPENVSEEVVGSASFIFSGCDEGDMSYQIGVQHGRMKLYRITRLMGIDCGQILLPPERPEGVLSGSWYDPSHNGEGYNVEVLINGQVVVYWFSYDPEGKRRWFFGLGEIRLGKLVFDEILTSSGGVFGPEFDPQSVVFKPWGTLELDLTCEGGTANYSSTEEGFGSGTLNVVRLTNIDQLACP